MFFTLIITIKKNIQINRNIGQVKRISYFMYELVEILITNVLLPRP